jgi:hypothetical protein
MTNKITFFAIVGRGATVDRPLGLVRRLQYDNGWEDEVLRRDFSWRRSPLIVEWERGSYDKELVEVSHEQASRTSARSSPTRTNGLPARTQAPDLHRPRDDG